MVTPRVVAMDKGGCMDLFVKVGREAMDRGYVLVPELSPGPAAERGPGRIVFVRLGVGARQVAEKISEIVGSCEKLV
jgi:hypothetical protein